MRLFLGIFKHCANCPKATMKQISDLTSIVFFLSKRQIMKLNIIRLLLIIHLTKADEEPVCCQDLFLTITDIITAPMGIVGPWSTITRNNTMNVSDGFHSIVGNHSLKRINGNRWRLDQTVRRCMPTTTTSTTITATTTEDTTTTSWCDENTEYEVWWAEGTINETCDSKNSTTKFVTKDWKVAYNWTQNGKSTNRIELKIGCLKGEKKCNALLKTPFSIFF